MNEFTKLIKKKMIDAGIENFKDLAKSIGMKYDTFLVRMKAPSSFRSFEIVSLAEVLGLSDEEIVTIVRS